MKATRKWRFHRHDGGRSAGPSGTRAATCLLAAGLIVATGGWPGTALANGGNGKAGPKNGSARSKLDERVSARLAEGDEAPQRVIVTLRPGAKQRGLLRALEAQGAKINADYTLIEALAGDLPPGLLRALEHHPDVVAISTDAVVTPTGLSTSVSGTALNSAYTLRSTLGLQVAGGTTVTRSFQQGDANGYTGTVDGGVFNDEPSKSYGSATTFKVEEDLEDKSSMLIAFSNLFGSGPNQIPVGSTITSVTLRIGQNADSSSSASAFLLRMLVPWSATATWSSMNTSGAGIQRDGVEASASADASISNLSTSGHRTFSGTGLVSTVQAWANGAPNHGWVLWQNDDDGWTVRTSEDGSLANRHAAHDQLGFGR